MYNKEQVYNEQIYPLMDKIIKICQENDIQMIASYCLSVEDEGLMCTTYLNSQDENCDIIKDANRVIQCGYTVSRPFVIEYTSTRN